MKSKFRFYTGYNYNCCYEYMKIILEPIAILDKYPRVMNGVEIFPAGLFLKALWNSEIN